MNLIFKDSAIFNFNNVNLINEDNKLKFIGDIQIVFKDIQNFYNHFQIEKNNRKILIKLIRILFIILMTGRLSLMN
jgi:hypothetical protein